MRLAGVAKASSGERGLLTLPLVAAMKRHLGFRVRVAEAGEECAPNLEARGDQVRAVSDL